MEIRKKIVLYFSRTVLAIWNFFLKIKDWLKQLEYRELNLSKPVKKYLKLRILKRSLMGISFYFFSPFNHKIYSPIDGVIEKIFPDNKTILLQSKRGLQIILTIKTTALDNSDSIFEIIRWMIKEKQEVKKNTVLFIIYFRKKVSSVVVLIPWQPWLIKKINLPTFWKGDSFAKISFLNKKEIPKIKIHGVY